MPCSVLTENERPRFGKQIVGSAVWHLHNGQHKQQSQLLTTSCRRGESLLRVHRDNRERELKKWFHVDSVPVVSGSVAEDLLFTCVKKPETVPFRHFVKPMMFALPKKSATATMSK